MKAKLIKINGEYLLNPAIVGTKLSIKNCQTIERGYDLDELANEYYKEMSPSSDMVDVNVFKAGFQKALELMGDKKFTEEDMVSAIIQARDVNELADVIHKRFRKGIDEIIDSLQKNEWDVEVEIEYQNTAGKWFSKPTILSELNRPERPKLDADECLILKRVTD